MTRDCDWLFANGPATLGPVTLTDGSGEIPAALDGTVLRSGPGRQHIGPDLLHFFDGDGLLCAARFQGGSVTVHGRQLDGRHSAKEAAAGRQLFRRPFTNVPKRWSNLLNVKLANAHAHDAVGWAGRLLATDGPGWLAFDEALRPVEHPVDALTKPPAQVAPMPRYDPWRDRLTVYRVVPGLAGDRLEIYEIDRDWTVHRVGGAALPARGLVLHDAVSTERHLVVASFGQLSLPKVAWGAEPAIEALDFDRSQGCRIFAIARDGTRVHTVKMPPGMQGFHLFNAWETGPTLTIDCVLYEGRVDFRAAYPPGFPNARAPDPLAGPFPTRLVHDLSTGATTVHRFTGVHLEAPEVDARRHGHPTRWGWGAARTDRGDEPLDTAYFWFHGIGRLDFASGAFATWSAGPRVFASPPAFAPRGPDEGDGWLVSWLYDAATARSGLAVFDAMHLEDGPIATRWLDRALPGISHVSWMPARAAGS